MKMYIAGPISGHDPKWVRNRFRTVAIELRILDIDPINPNAMSDWGLSWDAYMNIAETIFKTGEIDGVLMLEGWEHSKGARLEHAWAVLDKIPIYYEKDGILEPAQMDPGDTWYRENFVEKYDDALDASPKIEFKYSAVVDDIVKAIKGGEGIPREVKK